nr:GntR family transcriptional regulator [Streptomyces antimycoticus]
MEEIGRPGTLYQQVTARIRSGIATYEHKPGAPLPSEAQLIERYKASRPNRPQDHRRTPHGKVHRGRRAAGRDSGHRAGTDLRDPHRHREEAHPARDRQRPYALPDERSALEIPDETPPLHTHPCHHGPDEWPLILEELRTPAPTTPNCLPQHHRQPRPATNRINPTGELSKSVFTYSRRLAPLTARRPALAGPAPLSPPRSTPTGVHAARTATSRPALEKGILVAGTVGSTAFGSRFGASLEDHGPNVVPSRPVRRLPDAPRKLTRP